jgi:tRNA A-37 threonylcarbamoyl transferase component Bud32
LTGLRTEKIIHEEEWRAITHGLQYDIESGMLEGRIAADDPSNPSSICGIPVSTFTSHFQTFTDIFLQDPYGTYRHRVSEFAPRLFFVVGGNDPIVPTRSVLDTSPPDGINMIEIAKLSHFIATERGEWPDFWLPTITNIISSLSDHSEHLLWTTTLNNLWNDEPFYAAESHLLNLKNLREHTAKFRRHANSVRLDPEPLNSEEIQRTILRFVKLLENREEGEREERGKGFLLVLRNQIPVTLMGRKVLHRRGAVPHYDDLEIQKYWAHLQEQRLGMREAADRVTIVIPAHLNDWFVERIPTLSFKHLPIVQEFPDHQSQQAEIWKEFLEDWEATGALYRFDAQTAMVSGEGFQLEKLIRDDTATPSDFWIMNCLPDTWISLSAAAVKDFAGGEPERDEILNALRKRMLRIYTAYRKKGKEALTVEEEKARADLYRLLEKDDLQILRISAAQSSPRYLGERVRDRSVAIDVLMHAALALARSTQCREKDDFARGWKAGETVKQFGIFPLKEIGHGAMADVYESVKEDRVIAIKRMSQEALRDPNNRKRFAHEAKVSLGLNHPNIVRVYDYGEIDGVPSLLMERLYGEPLKSSIDAHKRFAPRDAVCLAIQLADALDYMHLRNVYHRDLKPGNIMLVDGGNTAKIMDFGIAVTPDTERLTETGMVIGTPRYMLPDSLAGYEALQRSDLYALGLILYEMLTGQYAAEPRARFAKDHPRPSAVVPDLPPSLDVIVAKLLARDPSVGYESARQLLDDLKTFLDSEA